VPKEVAGVGWPSCATIHGAGCNACGTCPHFTKKKSPLNIRPEVAAASPGGTQTDQAHVNRLVLFVIVGLTNSLSSSTVLSYFLHVAGLVSKHRDRPYRGGRQKHWIKVKNRTHPAMNREM
jgi:hypothetical protein